jgi:hypothetical protein
VLRVLVVFVPRTSSTHSSGYVVLANGM